MTFSFPGNDRRAVYSEDDYRAYLISRNPPPIVHHSSGVLLKRLRVYARYLVSALDTVLHRAIEALAVAKMRRIRRELQLRGIVYPPLTDGESRPLRSLNKSLPRRRVDA